MQESHDSADVQRWRSAFQDLILSFGSGLRHTQDSPVLSDVWMHFADKPGQNAPVIIVPDYKTESRILVSRIAELAEPAGDISSKDEDDESIWRGYDDDGEDDSANRLKLFALSNDVSALVDLDTLTKTLLPMTNWWLKEAVVQKRLKKIVDDAGNALETAKDQSGSDEESSPRNQALRKGLVHAFRRSREKEVWRLLAILGVLDFADAGIQEAGNKKDAHNIRWRRIGEISEMLLSIGDDTNRDKGLPKLLVRYIRHTLWRISYDWKAAWKEHHDSFTNTSPEDRYPTIWKINLNRTFNVTVAASRKTVKADAAARVFEHTTKGVTWAILDSGVDATHPTFQNRTPEQEIDRRIYQMSHGNLQPCLVRSRAMNSRIKATYDFNRLELLLKRKFEDLLLGNQVEFVELLQEKLRLPRGKAIVAYLVARHSHSGRVKEMQQALKRLKSGSKVSNAKLGKFWEKFPDVNIQLKDIQRYVLLGREINWSLVEPIINIPHDENYRPPSNPHGTHVASTLCGKLLKGELTRIEDKAEALENQKKEEEELGKKVALELEHYPDVDLIGVCPELEIYDLRVCGESGEGEEFVVLAALQFIHHLNRDRDKMEVQGANISLALRHDIRNFACGRTPVCLESERLVANGVVVVAAAGNAGISNSITASGQSESYRAMSITDPGNAEGVITVGATHKREPHTYGISYFSSRGPTGDGRQKPDLVAPGEKITAAVPYGKIDIMDGTSMAAPHVSGAAAMLMARHRELIRQPTKVKRILCETATDLGRERRFQGAGLVDLLRALQSV